MTKQDNKNVISQKLDLKLESNDVIDDVIKYLREAYSIDGSTHYADVRSELFATNIYNTINIETTIATKHIELLEDKITIHALRLEAEEGDKLNVEISFCLFNRESKDDYYTVKIKLINASLKDKKFTCASADMFVFLENNADGVNSN